MSKLLLLIIMFIISTPVFGQLSCPSVPKLDPGPIKFYRIALVPTSLFSSQAVANAVVLELQTRPEMSNYIPKVFKVGNSYQVVLMVKIMFFDRKEAEKALTFIQERPEYATSHFAAKIVEDSVQ